MTESAYANLFLVGVGVVCAAVSVCVAAFFLLLSAVILTGPQSTLTTAIGLIVALVFSGAVFCILGGTCVLAGVCYADGRQRAIREEARQVVADNFAVVDPKDTPDVEDVESGKPMVGGFYPGFGWKPKEGK